MCQAPRAATPFWLAETHEQLIEHSLLLGQSETDGEVRFAALEMVRQFAAEKLPQASQRALQRRHALYFAELCQRAASQRRSAELPLWLARLDREHENARAALEWALKNDAALAL